MLETLDLTPLLDNLDRPLAADAPAARAALADSKLTRLERRRDRDGRCLDRKGGGVCGWSASSRSSAASKPRAVRQALGGDATPHTVRINACPHVSAYAPSGAGKNTCLILPHLDTGIVVDLKDGENCKYAARRRGERLGQRQYLIDPYSTGFTRHDKLNPLDFPDPQAEQCSVETSVS